MDAKSPAPQVVAREGWAPGLEGGLSEKSPKLNIARLGFLNVLEYLLKSAIRRMV